MTDIVRNTKDSLSAKQVTQLHKSADTDGSTKAIHHTLGPASNQASPGNHTHDGGQSAFLDAASVPDKPFVAVPWIPLPYSGGWTDFLAGYTAGAYRLVGDEVQLRGVMKHATTTTTGIFVTMPVGYRSPAGHIWLVWGSGGGGVDIRSNSTGAISVIGYGASASGAAISLSVIRYTIA